MLTINNISDKEIIKYFNFFLRVKNPILPKAKKKKLKFLKKIILSNKALFSMPYQLCSCNIAKELNIKSPNTVTVWLRDLVRYNILDCVNKHYCAGKFSKKYKFSKPNAITNDLFIFINELNGYNNQLDKKNNKTFKENLETTRKKQLIRDDAWVEYLNTREGFEYSKIHKISNLYLNSFNKFIEDCKRHIPEPQLKGPSLFNHKRCQLGEFINSYIYVMKHNNLNKVTDNKFKKIVLTKEFKERVEKAKKSVQCLDLKVTRNRHRAYKHVFLHYGNTVRAYLNVGEIEKAEATKMLWAEFKESFKDGLGGVATVIKDRIDRNAKIFDKDDADSNLVIKKKRRKYRRGPTT